MLHVNFTADAVEDIQSFRKYDQERIVDAIETNHAEHAAEPSRNRKRLRPNRLSEWELRVGEFRVFYVDVENAMVRIDAIGHKQGNRLFIRGKEFEL
ncbi:MAG: type II toxin-antitoxin system RelE/ParE family toxin [Planctomycetia bacterium]|nr:type II toxin-antitoxin system RelE/ParE family toxin [Planctomycetia bacterium]